MTTRPKQARRGFDGAGESGRTEKGLTQNASAFWISPLFCFMCLCLL
ncbi:hypothetical protein GTCCBUS3UF5_24490 [Geobacillus thermoleovorans CCB_US3_UF5]|uniref:Uncharacterized protein n=1 Tax=Geobacillus thermoleovorans CCB_US3_UF5 TaxID=1111068 RepID=A0ABM5MJA9_GEOTH|nr:hypothetical protein GTCCBUS3UF5_24490 [Geobacillus thermoleovorans CCB_US3_UF5]